MRKLAFAAMITLASIQIQAAEFPAPSATCNTMSDLEMPSMSAWKDYGYGMGFGCNSSYLNIGSSGPGLPNNLAYYADGESNRVNQVKLVLNVNQRPQESQAKAALLEASQQLAERTLGEELPPEIIRSLTSGENIISAAKEAEYEVRRSDWPTGKGYELHFIIR